MKKIILILFVPLLISGCLGLVFNTADARLYNTRFSKGYSHRKFKKIEAGFTRDRVIEIIGEPISKYTTDYYYGVLYSNDKRSSIRPYSGGVSVPLDSGTEKEHRFLYFQCNSSGKIIWFSHITKFPIAIIPFAIFFILITVSCSAYSLNQIDINNIGTVFIC